MDWREMAGRATIDQDEVAGDYMRLPPSLGRHKQPWADAVQDQGNAPAQDDPVHQQEIAQQLAQTAQQATLEDQSSQYGYIAADSRRAWVLGASWIAASLVEWVASSWYLASEGTDCVVRSAYSTCTISSDDQHTSSTSPSL